MGRHKHIWFRDGISSQIYWEAYRSKATTKRDISNRIGKNFTIVSRLVNRMGEAYFEYPAEIKSEGQGRPTQPIKAKSEPLIDEFERELGLSPVERFALEKLMALPDFRDYVHVFHDSALKKEDEIDAYSLVYRSMEVLVWTVRFLGNMNIKGSELYDDEIKKTFNDRWKNIKKRRRELEKQFKGSGGLHTVTESFKDDPMLKAAAARMYEALKEYPFIYFAFVNLPLSLLKKIVKKSESPDAKGYEGICKGVILSERFRTVKKELERQGVSRRH